MCGIFGGFWCECPEFFLENLAQSRDLLIHRGPDDSGLEIFKIADCSLSLGHTRLSILDLTSGGHQPMHSRDERFVIVFNGEIYNYLELRQELRHLGHEFRTESDTEVLLAAWAQWGADCLHRLIGMFAFAILDQQEENITLVRDAFGIKPLFYSLTQKKLIFASELPALLILRQESAEFNVQRAYDYLINGVVDSGIETFINGVSHVPPGHCVRVDLSMKPLVQKVFRWWTPSVAETFHGSFEQAAEMLRDLFLESVKLHLRSDVPLGVALSGGVDSSAIACAMRFLEPDMDIHTFSYISSDNCLSEEAWIDVINGHVKAIPHKVYISEEDFIRDLPALILAQGEPFGGTSIYAQYCIFRRAKDSGVTVVLEGQGGDELLGGYVGYPGQMMLSYLERHVFGDMINFAKNWSKWPGRNRFGAWRALIGQLLPDYSYNLANSLVGRKVDTACINIPNLIENNVRKKPLRPRKSIQGKGRRLVETLLQSLTINGLPHLLRYGDRNAMAFSVENRVPFLTLPLCEFLLSLPECFLVSNSGETKAVFRRAMRGIVPDAILDRRDKVGFDTPMKVWMRKFISQDRDLLNNDGYIVCPIFRTSQLKAYVNDAFKSSEDFAWQMWRILNLNRWYQNTIMGNTPQN